MAELGKLVVTSDHHCMLNEGGLMLLCSEELEGMLDEDEEVTAATLAGCSETQFLSPAELLQIADLVQVHRAKLEAARDEGGAYLLSVARSWLDEFAEQARALCERGEYWWPQIRNEARQALLKQCQQGSNPILLAWYRSVRGNQAFPRGQQEELLTRTFQREYYKRYPIQERSDEETTTAEQDH